MKKQNNQQAKNHRWFGHSAFLVAMSLLLAGFSAQAAILITEFGTEAGASGGWSYNSASSTISGTEAGGALLYNVSGLNGGLGLDLTPEATDVASIQLKLTGLVTTIPFGVFNLTLTDSDGAEARWDFNWASFSGSLSTVTVSNVESGQGFNLASIVDWNLTSGGSDDPVNATFTRLEAVPEPSSFSLLMLGAAGLVALRRLRKV